MYSLENRFDVSKWVKISFVNLLVVALFGVVMRYKIAYSLPFIDQKNLLHAHSHFAFYGWLNQILMALLVAFLFRYLSPDKLTKYKWILGANLVIAYGMLLSFSVDGYGIFSIILSNTSILISYFFAVLYWLDLDKIKIKTVSKLWFKAALFFSVISSFGAFFLAYMTVNQIQHPTWLQAGFYYFLHFQYNGWFFFACMGLFSEQLKSVLSFSLQELIFWLFALACIPAYFLSALWLPIPLWIYVIVVIAAASQLLGWMLMVKTILAKKHLFDTVSTQLKWLFIISAGALTIKLVLQLGSTVPFLSQLAFGFRPVVIGYLHLMFLGVITVFIIAYCKMHQFILTSKAGNTGISIFVGGIVLNEILLMIQGFSYMNYTIVPCINESLLGAASCMLCGLIMLNVGIKKRDLTSS